MAQMGQASKPHMGKERSKPNATLLSEAAHRVAAIVDCSLHRSLLSMSALCPGYVRAICFRQVGEDRSRPEASSRMAANVDYGTCLDAALPVRSVSQMAQVGKQLGGQRDHPNLFRCSIGLFKMAGICLTSL